MKDEDREEQLPENVSLASHSVRKKNDTLHMKILVPSGTVGAIIGKGGESIAKVQRETGAKIRLSKPNDFYPGTQERVCLILGTFEGVTEMHNYIMDRMLEKPDPSVSYSFIGPTGVVQQAPQTSVDPTLAGSQQSSSEVELLTDASTLSFAGSAGCKWIRSPSNPAGGRVPWGRHQQVKILVPNCTAGLVIGKKGTYVEEIKDRTGAFVQVSQKSREINLPERCITIAGEAEQCRAAVALVLTKIAEDPQSTSCPTISYSTVQGPVASAYPIGSPFAFSSAFPPSEPTSRFLPTSDNLLQHGTTAFTPSFASPSPLDLFHATALAAGLSQRAYFAPSGYVATSPSPATQCTAGPAQPPQPGFVLASPTDVFSSGHGVGASGHSTGDIGGLYGASLTSSLPPNTILAGSPETWSTAAGTPTGYEQTYPTQLGFAYYPTDATYQSGEPYSPGIGLYAASSLFGDNLPHHAHSFNTGSTIRTPPVCSVTQQQPHASPTTVLTPVVYPTSIGHHSGIQQAAAAAWQTTGPPDITSAIAGKPAVGTGVPGAVPTLTRLFSSFRLGARVPDFSNPDFIPTVPGATGIQLQSPPHQQPSQQIQGGVFNIPGYTVPTFPVPNSSVPAMQQQPLITGMSHDGQQFCLSSAFPVDSSMASESTGAESCASAPTRQCLLAERIEEPTHCISTAESTLAPVQEVVPIGCLQPQQTLPVADGFQSTVESSTAISGVEPMNSTSSRAALVKVTAGQPETSQIFFNGGGSDSTGQCCGDVLPSDSRKSTPNGMKKRNR